MTLTFWLLAWAAVVSSAQRPNLLLLFPDEWRWDYAGFDADRAELRMPHLQALAARGTRFNFAYTPSAWCAPARACLASGMHYDRSPKTLNGEDYPVSTRTWYKVLQEEGYHTMIVGKDDLTQSLRGTSRDGSRHAHELGMADWFRMQDKYVTYRQSPWDQYGVSLQSKPCGLQDSGGMNLFECNHWCYGMFGRGHCCHVLAHEGYDCPGHDQVGPNQDDYIDNYVTSQAEALLDRAPAGKPWALHVSFPGPHPPFVITEAMNRSIANRHFPTSKDNVRLPAERQLSVRRQYAAEIENLDSLFGKLLAKVLARGEAANTLVVITSDHGEQLGDQNAFGKKMPWEPSIRVPLVIAGPGVAAGRIVDIPVSTLDVIGTFLERAGARQREQFDARSLQPLLDDTALEADEASYLRGRPYVSTGLSYPGGSNGPELDYRAIITRVNRTHVMKVICCPQGCPKGNSHAPSTAPEPQLLAFNVAPGGELDTVSLHATADARLLAERHLPGSYATACLGGRPAQDTGATPEPAGPPGQSQPMVLPALLAGLAALATVGAILAAVCLRKDCRMGAYSSMEDSGSDESIDDGDMS